MSGMAWVTLATNDSYSLGALVLAHSLRQVNTNHQLVVIITPGVTNVMREKLSTVFDELFEVNILDSKDEVNLKLLHRPELGVTFTKLHCWRLTKYSKCVFLDADTLVLQNCDELFERDELSAAPDVGWPDCFNSGVFVYTPSNETFESLIKFALEHGSFDGGDQGLLNLYFADWAHKDIRKHLPFIYNMCSTACYSYLPAFKQFGEGVKIIHFIGSSKPWLQFFNTETLQVSCAPEFHHLHKVLQHWWDLFCAHVHSKLTAEMSGIAGALAQMTLGETKSGHQIALEDHLRRQCWEMGNIDYMGRDSFDNIWKKISETIAVPIQQASQSVTNAEKKTENVVADLNIKSKIEEPKNVEIPLTPIATEEMPPTSPSISLLADVGSSQPPTASTKQKSTDAAKIEKPILKQQKSANEKQDKSATAAANAPSCVSPGKAQVPIEKQDLPTKQVAPVTAKLKETEQAPSKKTAASQKASPQPSAAEQKPTAAESISAPTSSIQPTPTPPPRKGNKNGSASTPTKKSSKKK